MGNEVDVLCFGNKNCLVPIEISDGVRVFHVRDRLWELIKKESKNKYVKRIGNILCRISQLIFMYWFPMTSWTVPKRFENLALNLQKLNQYDIVVSSYAPFEAAWAGWKVKKKFKDVKWVLYILDTFTNRGKSKFFSEKWNDKHGWRWEKNFFPTADKIITLKCHEKHHQQERYIPYKNKLFFTDIPLYDVHKYDNVEMKAKTDEKNFVYTGRIDSHWYSPIEMCELFLQLCDNKNWKLHFFGNPSDCENYLDKMNEKSNGKIIKEGFISRKRVEYELKNADVLVSFSHKDSDMVQSKIFDYMSTGNKIIHLTDSTGRDSVREYYKEYPYAYILDSKDIKKKDTLRKVVEFIELDRNPNSANSIEDLFHDNRPNTTARIILS